MLHTEQERMKDLGAFDTPTEIAEFLASWAIRKSSDRVLDPGAGSGVFVEAAISRFAELGKPASQAIGQIFAVEKDKERYSHLLSELKAKHGFAESKNLILSDFFNVTPRRSWFSNIPEAIRVDAVIGNPPYVERQRLKNIKAIQRRILPVLEQSIDLHDVTDIYGYFILHSASFLGEGGRLAFIVSDTWLHMDFGRPIKEFLLSKFHLKAIVGFDRRVFSNALVRTILLLVERSSQPESDNQVTFVQLRDHDAVGKLHSVLSGDLNGDGWAKVVRVEQSSLVTDTSWSKYLKGSKVYFEIERNPRVTALGNIADVNIGLQTLRKGFYVFDGGKINQTRIEDKFLEPIALSPRYIPKIVSSKQQVEDRVLFCDIAKDKIRSRALVDYIESAEKLKISPRGKTLVVTGVHNLPRIKKAGRNPWYNLIPEIERRCRGPVLVPRRFYKKFYVTWNKAGVVANEDFVNVHPKKGVSTEALLAVLNSSFGELVCRINAQLYGGGVFDLRPDDVRTLPIIDVRQLSETEITALEQAYGEFIKTESRESVDSATYEILQLSPKHHSRLKEELEDLKSLSEISKG